MLAAEVEPNDSGEQAQAIPITDGSYTINGSVVGGASYSIDYFKLSLDEGTTIYTVTEPYRDPEGYDWMGTYPRRMLYMNGLTTVLYNFNEYRADYDQTILISVDRYLDQPGLTKFYYRYGAYDLTLHLNKAPAVASVSAPAAGTYAKGEQLTFTVTMSEPVTVSGSQAPALAMNFGETTRYASFSGYTSSSELNFTYTVQEGDDLGGTSSGTLTPSIVFGSIADSGGNTALRGFSPPSMTGIRLGGPSPTVSSITAPTGFLGIGMPVEVILHISEAVTVDTTSGTPKLPLTIGTATADALYVSGSGTTNLVFRFVPTAASPSGAIGIGEAVVLDGGSIESTVTKMAATTTLSGNLSTNAAVDAVAPTIAITSDKAALKAGETASITFTLSESATDFGEDDVTVSGGTLSGFAGTGASYTATFTPTAASTAPGSISVAAGKFTDAAGNTNTASDPLSLAIDTRAPTLRITSNASLLDTDGPFAISFTLSEPSTDFGADDVQSFGGTLTGFAGSGTTYSASFLPTPGDPTPRRLAVSAAAFTDAAGNPNTASEFVFEAHVAIALVASGSEAEGAPSVFRLTRTGDASLPLSVTVLLSGTAKAGSDYEAPPGLLPSGRLTVSFAAGARTADLQLPTLADSDHDPLETIVAIVQPAAGYRAAPAGGRAVAVIGAEGVAATWRESSSEHADGAWQNTLAVAALRSDGSVVTWGAPLAGGDSSAIDFDGPADNLYVTRIFSTTSAFAALRSDGSVVTWGYPNHGGDSSAVDFNGPADDLTVSTIFSTGSAFAALRSDGSVVTWGDAFEGGDSSAVDFDGPADNLTVSRIFSTRTAFAALRNDGSVVTWGATSFGGRSSGVDFDGPANDLSVSHIYANWFAFAALRDDGSVVTWGDTSQGGDSTAVDFNGPADDLTVAHVAATNTAFAAIRSDGSVVTWGDSFYGGDSSVVDFNGPADDLTVSRIFATNFAFAAIRSDGSVVTWGHPYYGADTSGIDFNGPADDLAVIDVSSTGYSFAALRSDGAVVTWGLASAGGTSAAVDFDGPADDLAISTIFSNNAAFAALRSDGSVLTWGDSSYGGDSTGVDFDGPANDRSIATILPITYAFAALGNDGSIVTWGDASFGGNSASVDFDGPNDDLAVAVVSNLGFEAWLSVDKVAPTIVITSDEATLKAGETATITFTLSESSSDFGEDDVTVSGGTLSNFTGSGTGYTATFTPTVASTTPGSITVADAKFTDAAGNSNTASNPLSITIDTVVPTIVITSNKAALKAGETATITFTLSESSTNFGEDDVTVSGGTLSNFTGTGANYTATFTPTTASTTSGSISVAAAKFTDAAGNANTASAPVAISIDTLLPTAVLTVVPVATGGAVASATVTFSEPVQGLRPADFQLTRNGATVPLTGAAVTGSGRTWTVTGIAPLTSSLGTYVFSLRGDAAARDLAGNPLAAGTSRSWTYAAPFEIVGLPATTTAALSKLTIRLNGPVKGFEKVDIRITLNGQPVSLLRATLSFKRGVYELSGLGPLTQKTGTYTVTIGRANSKMVDGNGKPITGVLQASWVKRR